MWFNRLSLTERGFYKLLFFAAPPFHTVLIHDPGQCCVHFMCGFTHVTPQLILSANFILSYCIRG